MGWDMSGTALNEYLSRYLLQNEEFYLMSMSEVIIVAVAEFLHLPTKPIHILLLTEVLT